MTGDDDLTRLALRAADGDRRAEEAFIARTMDDVWRYCAHAVGAAQADDATQATYLRALRALPNFRGESSPRTWLIGVARNTCLDERRSLARRINLMDRISAQPLDDLDHGHRPPGTLETEELLDALDPDRREAFVLTQILGFSYDEAAELAGCPVGTIRSRVARARADLLVQLRSGDPDAEAGRRPRSQDTA